MGRGCHRFPFWLVTTARNFSTHGNLRQQGAPITQKLQRLNLPIGPSLAINGGVLNNLFNMLVGSVEDGITATTSGTQANAYQLFATINRLTTVANATDAVKLPGPPRIGQVVQIINDGANPAQVFGHGTDTIDGVATATGVALTNATRAFFTCTGVTAAGAYAWRSQAGAKSS